MHAAEIASAAGEKDLMSRWHDYLPVTSARLRPTFVRALEERAQFSVTERVLFTTCDFWAAVCSRKLETHLDSNPLDNLRYTLVLYAALGANEVVSELTAVVHELQRGSQPQTLVLAKLQERLLRTRDPIDDLIVRLAIRLGFGSHSDPPELEESPVLALSAQA